ncbi:MULTISPECIES: hypothetical protein [unclassified Sphingopyxis]|uniref:hypothetical protein n=1 Tax=unclassified Sphingopyxis TaxID=2614943 RepID=UPI0012E3EB65|nr:MULTISPECIES: hypothetical protein [unclassified Sphingopyxis]
MSVVTPARQLSGQRPFARLTGYRAETATPAVIEPDGLINADAFESIFEDDGRGSC